MKLPPLVVAFIVAALMWCVSAAMPAFEFSFPGNVFLSLSIALIGAAICLSGVAAFRRAKTTVNPLKPDRVSCLVVSGIYKYTRNPMYLGFALMLLGWAAFLSNVVALAFLPAFVAYMNRFQIGPEERALAALFPNEFPPYCDGVRRWL